MPERHSDDDYSSSSSSSSRWSSSSSSHDSGSSSSSSSSRGKPISEWTSQDWTIALISWGVLGTIFLIAVVGNGTKNARDEDATATRRAANTATTRAITISDLAIMHAALDSRIPVWQQVTDREVHRVSAEEAGFKPDFNTKEVDYGYCDNDKFYVYVLNATRPGGFSGADTEGYSYTPNSHASACTPPGWRIVKEDSVGNGWAFVTISTYQATSRARNTLEPRTPTPLPPTRTTTPTLSKQ